MRCYTIKKNNDEKLDKSLEGILQKDLIDKKHTLPKYMKSQVESKSSIKTKELATILLKNNFLDVNQGFLSYEDTILIRNSFVHHFLFLNLSDEIM